MFYVFQKTFELILYFASEMGAKKQIELVRATLLMRHLSALFNGCTRGCPVLLHFAVVTAFGVGLSAHAVAQFDDAKSTRPAIFAMPGISIEAYLNRTLGAVNFNNYLSENLASQFMYEACPNRRICEIVDIPWDGDLGNPQNIENYKNLLITNVESIQ
jgi:hypothetical protein